LGSSKRETKKGGGGGGGARDAEQCREDYIQNNLLKGGKGSKKNKGKTEFTGREISKKDSWKGLPKFGRGSAGL